MRRYFATKYPTKADVKQSQHSLQATKTEDQFFQRKKKHLKQKRTRKNGEHPIKKKNRVAVTRSVPVNIAPTVVIPERKHQKITQTLEIFLPTVQRKREVLFFGEETTLQQENRFQKREILLNNCGRTHAFKKIFCRALPTFLQEYWRERAKEHVFGKNVVLLFDVFDEDESFQKVLAKRARREKAFLHGAPRQMEEDDLLEVQKVFCRCQMSELEIGRNSVIP